jgi:hypothetical protein
MKTSIKDIKAHAASIKASGGTGRAAWTRLENYVLSCKDTMRNDYNEVTIYCRDHWKSLTDIVPSHYFA